MQDHLDQAAAKEYANTGGHAEMDETAGDFSDDNHEDESAEPVGVIGLLPPAVPKTSPFMLRREHVKRNRAKMQKEK